MGRFLSLALIVSTVSNLAFAAAAKETPASIEASYQKCLGITQGALSEDEKLVIHRLRGLGTEVVARNQGLFSERSQRLYAKDLAELVKQVSHAETQRNFLQLQGVVAEVNYLRLIGSYYGLDRRIERDFRGLITDAIFEQKDFKVEKLENARRALVEAVFVDAMAENDRALGIKVPVSISVRDPRRLATTFTAINILSELALQTHSLNRELRKDRQRYLRGRVRQGAFAIGGFSVVVGTVVFGAPVMTASGAVTASVGLGALSGQFIGAMGLGALGGAAAEGVALSYNIMSMAYYRSLEKGTPLTCELQRKMAEESLSDALTHGAMSGGALGATGVGLATILPKITLWLMGGAVATGQAFEVGTSAYDLYQMKYHYNLAFKLSDLGVLPMNLRLEQESLFREAMTKARIHAQKAGEHAVAASIIATLTKPMFFDGDFKRAMIQGAQAIRTLTAVSSDTVPSVASSIGEAGNSALQGLRNPVVQAKETTLENRIEGFLAKSQGQTIARGHQTETLEFLMAP